MTILLIGFNYQTAPVALRERLYLTGDELCHALITLHQPPLQEVVILSTCNRLEVYACTDDADRALETVVSHLAARVALPAARLRPHLQVMEQQEAVRHLMRVAAGVESLVLGETEILGQVVGALAQAQQAATSGAVLSRLFQSAIHSGKRARTETAISQHTLSVSHAAALMAKQRLNDMALAKVLIVGAGRMAELAARALKARCAAVTIINRTFAKANALAARTDTEAREWHELETAIGDADVVITATSAPQPVLTADQITAARKPYITRPLIVIDIAVPRNVHKGVGLLPGVELYNIDALRSVVDNHRAKRQAEIARVEAIIHEELRSFLAWLNSRRAVSTIVALRQKAEALAEAEVTRALNRLPDLSDHERDVIAQMAQRIVNKMLHEPTVTLRERAALGGDHFAYLHAVRQLFDLEAEPPRD